MRISKNIKGRVHGIETLGALDGPGIRTVVFLQGCHLRCAYCHNPETWHINGGEEMTSQELINQIKRYKSYYGTEGGVTFSGGEPLLQPQFLYELLKGCKKEGIGTAIDTAGVEVTEAVIQVLKLTDLVILDIKMPDEARYHKLTGRYLSTILEFMKTAARLGCRIWIRHVVVPGLNDTVEAIEALRTCIEPLGVLGIQVEKIELMGYHRLGIKKYQECGYPYPLGETPEMSPLELEKLQTYLR